MSHTTTDHQSRQQQRPMIVNPFTVIVDNREQSAYTFENLPLCGADRGKRLVVPVVVKYIPTGDYSIEGAEDAVCVERKSLEDLFGTLGQGRQRFEAEFERMRAMQFAAVVVEATWEEICKPAVARPGTWQSRLNPRSVWGTVFAWSQRFPMVHWYTMGTKRLAEIATFEILQRWWQEEQDRSSGGK